MAATFLLYACGEAVKLAMAAPHGTSALCITRPSRADRQCGVMVPGTGLLVFAARGPGRRVTIGWETVALDGSVWRDY